MTKKVLLSVITCTVFSSAFSQLNPKQLNGSQLNAITTAVPFLGISPDSRAGGMGDAGVATSPDANSIHWNPAKLAFIEGDAGASLSVVPWLRQIVNDMTISYLSGYKRINANSTVGASLRYFALGEIQFTDERGEDLRLFKPNELALDGAYALKLSDRVSVGVAMRYVRSSLTGGSIVQGAETKAGKSVGFDVSSFYNGRRFRLNGKDAYLNFGVNISNVGTKMNYATSTRPDFIPTTLRIGPALRYDLDDYNTLNFTLELSRLLVPTPPIYEVDPATGEQRIVAGKDPEVSVAQGVFQSFGDAPGGGKEEMRENNIALGGEYLINNQVAIRAGYFYEHESKGGRQYATLGGGFKYQVFNIDLSYIIPTSNNNPLANTLRFTLRFNFTGANDSASQDDQNLIDG